MMDNMMKHFDDLDDTSIDMKHTGKSIEDIIDNNYDHIYIDKNDFINIPYPILLTNKIYVK